MNPVIYIKSKNLKNDKVILYSHGNSSDLSKVWKFSMNLAAIYEIDVVSYDYTGYGLSPNKSSEKEICNDAEHVLSFVVHHLKYDV